MHVSASCEIFRFCSLSSEIARNTIPVSCRKSVCSSSVNLRSGQFYSCMTTLILVKFSALHFLGSTFFIFPSEFLSWFNIPRVVEASVSCSYTLLCSSSLQCTVVFQFGSMRFEELTVITGRARVRMEDINTVRGSAWYSEGIVHDLLVRIQDWKTHTYKVWDVKVSSALMAMISEVFSPRENQNFTHCHCGWAVPHQLRNKMSVPEPDAVVNSEQFALFCQMKSWGRGCKGAVYLLRNTEILTLLCI